MTGERFSNMKKTVRKSTVVTDLQGKTVALTGSTGGIGKALSRSLATMGASLILLDRNEEKAQAWAETLAREFEGCRVTRYTVDLSDMDAVKATAEILKTHPIDILIHNAGAYSIPRCITSCGYDNVFTINFLSPYYLTRALLPQIRARGGKVIAVGSIAHRYSKTDKKDVDFRTRKRASLVYGNAKRYLMYAHLALNRQDAPPDVAVAHPGITFTGITAHYPKLIFAIIKYPMKVIFMKPERACRPILAAVTGTAPQNGWIGPRIFEIWGKPKAAVLRSADDEEKQYIRSTAERIYTELAGE